MRESPPLPRLVLALLIAVITFSLAACGTIEFAPDLSLERVVNAGKLKVAIDPSYPPFDFVDENERIAGFDADLARAIGNQLGVEVEFVPIDVGTIYDGLIARKYDVIISALPPAPELGKEIAFTRPYFNAGQTFVVRNDERLAVDDLASRRIAVEMGTSGESLLRDLAKSQNRELEIRVYDSPQAAVAAVDRGDADAGVLDVLTALEVIKDHQQLTVTAPALNVEPYVIAVRRKDAALLEAVQDQLITLEQEGVLAKLERQWLPGLPPEWQ